MADPTKGNRDLLVKAAANILPNSPLGQSAAAKIAADEEQLKTDEANNYVMQRGDPNLPPEAQAFVNPGDPSNAAPVSQDVATQSAAPAAIPATPAAQAALQAPSDPAKTERAPAMDDFSKLGAGIDDRQKKLEEEARAEVERKERVHNDTITKLDDIEKKGPFKFDNSSLWSKSSTGQRVALLIGGFLSSLSDSGAKSFQSGIQSAIDRDMAIQMKKYEEGKLEKSSMLSQLKDQLGDVNSAKSALQSIMYKGISDKMHFQMEMHFV